MEKISIIVPVYNVEPFLRKCVKSLINQTYKNIEIILVNDGSPDNCGKICDAFAKEDKRIKVVHQVNKGLCGARNAGLKIATGKYIGFVDSDDWVDLDMFEYLFTNMQTYNADITACRYYKVKNKITPKTDGKLYIFNSKEAIENIITEYSLRTFFCNKLFKKETFNNITFPEGKVYEGTKMMYKLFLLVEKIVLLPEPKYYYVSFSGSIVNSRTLKNQVDYICAHIERYNDLHTMFPEFDDLLLLNIIKECIKLISIYLNSSKLEIESNKDSILCIQNFIKMNKLKIEQHSKVKKITMLKLGCFVNSKSKFNFYISNLLIILSKKIKAGRKAIRKFINCYKKKVKKIFKKKTSTAKKISINIDEFTKEDIKIFNKLHDLEIFIMNDFVRICEKYNLKYYLYGGTLLGAVRHNGFIPWDDDVDIVMPRKDYEKFGKLCLGELNSKLFYQTCFTDPEYPKLSAKIRINNTYVGETKWDQKKMHKGIFIDILPLDFFPENKLKGYFLLQRFSFINNLCNENKCSSGSIIIQLAFKLFEKLPKKILYKLRERLLKNTHKYQNSSLYCSFGSHYRPLQKRILKKEWFSGDEYMMFEGKKYRVPLGWKEYLIHLFGTSYMELPPISKRINHFNFYDVEFKNANDRKIIERKG